MGGNVAGETTTNAGIMRWERQVGAGLASWLSQAIVSAINRPACRCGGLPALRRWPPAAAAPSSRSWPSSP
jgi:hypothetical protein